jgi:hypothetical protein
MNSDEFRIEVTAFLSDISKMIETRITGDQAAGGGIASFSPAMVTRFILSASFGISMQQLLSPENADVRAGFEIIKAATTIILQA